MKAVSRGPRDEPKNTAQNAPQKKDGNKCQAQHWTKRQTQRPPRPRPPRPRPRAKRAPCARVAGVLIHSWPRPQKRTPHPRSGSGCRTAGRATRQFAGSVYPPGARAPGVAFFPLTRTAWAKRPGSGFIIAKVARKIWQMWDGLIPIHTNPKCFF